MTTPHWAGRLDYGLLAWWGIFMPFLQMHPFFQGNFNKKTITSTYRFGIEFCTPYRFRITAHIRPIVSELRANTVTALFAQK